VNDPMKTLRPRAASISTDWDQGALANVGLELVSRWPVVEQALERFEQILTPKGSEFDEVDG
jgi:hypothetical protein